MNSTLWTSKSTKILITVNILIVIHCLFKTHVQSNNHDPSLTHVYMYPFPFNIFAKIEIVQITFHFVHIYIFKQMQVIISILSFIFSSSKQATKICVTISYFFYEVHSFQFNNVTEV